MHSPTHTRLAQPDDFGNDYSDRQAWLAMRDGWPVLSFPDLDCRHWLTIDLSDEGEGDSVVL